MSHTVVVGGGASGAVLAARLSEDADREVTLVEAGSAAGTPPALLDGASILAAVPGHPLNWSYPAWLQPGQPHVVPRGRLLGGSSAINGGYFVRARARDFARWAEVGGSQWSFESALPLLRAIEHDLDFAEKPAHGASGPIRVRRSDQTGTLASAFVRAARELGFAYEPDKNGLDESIGVGPVPSNIVDGVRVNTAMAYLTRARLRPNLRILGDTRVLRVMTHHHRVTGVETDTRVIDADEVVLAAGAVATPQLLMLSGIGPRTHLALHKIASVADLPVGESFSDHPNLAVGWRSTRRLIDPTQHFAFPTALNFDSTGSAGRFLDGDIEILLTVKPVGMLLGREIEKHPLDDEGEYQLMVALQSPKSRGRLSLLSADPLAPPHIDFCYLQLPEDRTAMRVGVRTAANLLHSQAFKHLFLEFTSLDEATLAHDEMLDAWVSDHLSTAIHLSGSAPIGPVVDGEGRVHGVHGLRVADTSLLPMVPSRGPFNTAVFIGEFIARCMLNSTSE